MGIVDFSKAKIEVWSKDGQSSPFRQSNMNFTDQFFHTFPYKDDEGTEHTRTNSERMNANSTYTQHMVNGTEIYMFTGYFIQDGTSFVIMANNAYQGWRVSNIKFKKDDSYAFAIVITVPSAS